jgi:hypothetical protein
MLYIQHRKNTIDELKKVDSEYGVEIDIRSDSNQLILQHDPFSKGTLLSEWLKFFRHQTLILNVKEEGLENEIIALLKKFKIEDFFFLDQSFPFLIKGIKSNMKKSAVRFSEYEDLNTALSLSNMAEWVWVDFFTMCPLNSSSQKLLREANFKICIVSPELQGYPGESYISQLAQKLKNDAVIPNAICTKYPDIWKKCFQY